MHWITHTVAVDNYILHIGSFQALLTPSSLAHLTDGLLQVVTDTSGKDMDCTGEVSVYYRPGGPRESILLCFGSHDFVRITMAEAKGLLNYYGVEIPVKKSSGFKKVTVYDIYFRDNLIYDQNRTVEGVIDIAVDHEYTLTACRGTWQSLKERSWKLDCDEKVRGQES